MHAEELSPSAQLKEVRVFAFGGVGYGGHTSPGELAMRALMQSADRRSELERLIKDGNPQAQFYGIAAFKLIDARRYTELLDAYSKREGKVLVGWGCIQAKMDYSDVVKWMREDRLEAPASLINEEADQDGTGQPATSPESKPEGGGKPQPESERPSR